MFTNFVDSKHLFIALNKESIWHDRAGYYLYDLDSIRSKEWIFCRRPIQNIIEKENLRLFNYKLYELLKIHNQKSLFY